MIYNFFLKTNCYRLIFIIFSFIFTSSSFAAVLHWSPVDSIEECVISGYKVHYGTSSGEYTNIVDIDGQDNTSCDLDALNLVLAQTYYFAVSAYSTIGLESSLSLPISYTTQAEDTSVKGPYIVQYPSIDYINNIIDVTFSENNMQGTDVKNNYDFSPTIFFNKTYDIVLPDEINQPGTYRLLMDYIPERTIITMTVSNITDDKGNVLVFSTIVLNDNDSDSMADDWETYYGIRTAFLDADADGLANRSEFEWGTSPVDDDSDDDGMDDGWEVQNSLNPVLDDADGDIDGDGISNFDEYNGVVDEGIQTLQGFDKSYYLSAKLAALQANDSSWDDKTTNDLDSFLKNVGFLAETHYSQYGYLEGLEPNQYFNHSEYILAKATAMNNSGTYSSVEEAQAAFNATWPYDAYQHYLQYGAAEGINPSNSFDESEYLADKLAALRAEDSDWDYKTIDDLRILFDSYGMTVLDHYMNYGAAEGLSVTPVPDY